MPTGRGGGCCLCSRFKTFPEFLSGNFKGYFWVLIRGFGPWCLWIWFLWFAPCVGFTIRVLFGACAEEIFYRVFYPLDCPPSRTLSQNSEVPCGPIALCRKVPIPRGVSLAFEKCWMLWSITASCIAAPSVGMRDYPPSVTRSLVRGSVSPVCR